MLTNVKNSEKILNNEYYLEKNNKIGSDKKNEENN